MSRLRSEIRSETQRFGKHWHGRIPCLDNPGDNEHVYTIAYTVEQRTEQGDGDGGESSTGSLWSCSIACYGALQHADLGVTGMRWMAGQGRLSIGLPRVPQRSSWGDG